MKLHDGISESDLEQVERSLEEGASPLAIDEGHRSVLRATHDHAVQAPAGRAVFLAVKRAARVAIEGSVERRVGLASAPLSAEHGFGEVRRLVEASQRLDVLLVEAEVKRAAGSLASLVRSPRRESDVASRPVEDAARLAFVYRLRGSAWAVVPLVFEDDSPWSVAKVTELAARGEGIAPLARAIAMDAGTRVIHLEYERFTIYSGQGGVERRTFEPDESFEGSPAERRGEELRRLDVAVGEIGALVPPMRARTDGWGVQLELSGVAPTDVERIDVVVLSEFGEPTIDRTLGAPAQAPAAVGPPPMVKLPLVVEPGPPKSDAKPLERQPPPMVKAPPPSAPPNLQEPPPIVAKPEPPMVKPGELE